MNRGLPSLYNKFKAVALLFCLLLMMVSTCPVRSLLSSASFSIGETFRQPNNTKASVNNNFSCSFEGKVTQATFLDLSKRNSNSLPLPFILALLKLYLFISIFNTWGGFINKYRNPSLIYHVPLFLRNRSIII